MLFISPFEHMFVAKNCENISFSGLGIIDMQGIWENENTPGEGEWCAKRAVKIFALKGCKNIVIKDLTLLKSTDTALYLAGCEGYGEQICKSYVMPSTVTGQPDKKLENITLSNFYFTLPGGCKEDLKDVKVPEITKSYPENYAFGDKFPAYGIFFRHIKNLKLSNINITSMENDTRNELHFEDVE